MSRENWSNKILYISTVAGATIGFGATWRFPYQVGQNGGGAYLLVFIIAMIILGVPMLMAEHIVGRRMQTNTVDAFVGNDPNKPISKAWKLIGILGIIGAFGILAYYMVLGGWVLSYMGDIIIGILPSKFVHSLSSIMGDITMSSLNLKEPLEGKEIATFFKQSISNPWKIVGYTLFFVLVNYFILVKGIIKGIEKLISYVMPLFLLLVIGMVLFALQLPNAMEGVKFYLIPDFSLINANVILEALGQVFFALSLGFGVMITLSSYLDKKENMVGISLMTGVINTMIPLAIGFIIFPALAFAQIEPNQGPTLVFQILPTVFSNMPFGSLVGFAFFLLLILAALTTSITIYEVIITTLVEKTVMSRNFATLLTLTVIFLLGNLPSILSNSIWSNIKIFGMSIFDAFDFVSANVFFVLTSLLICIFIGFVIGRKAMIKEITNDGEINQKLAPILFNYIKYIMPLLIFIIAIMAFI